MLVWGAAGGKGEEIFNPRQDKNFAPAGQTEPQQGGENWSHVFIPPLTLTYKLRKDDGINAHDAHLAQNAKVQFRGRV